MVVAKLSLGMKISIVSTAVTAIGILIGLTDVHIKNRERIARVEGSMEQLKQTVSILEQAQMQHAQMIRANARKTEVIVKKNRLKPE